MAEKNNWLKKSLQDKFEAEQAPVSEELWEKIAPRIQAPKKKHRFIWIWFLFGALGLAAFGFAIWNNLKGSNDDLSNNVISDEFNEEVEKRNETAIIDESIVNISEEEIVDVKEKDRKLVVDRDKEISKKENVNDTQIVSKSDESGVLKYTVNRNVLVPNSADSDFIGIENIIEKEGDEFKSIEIPANNNTGGLDIISENRLNFAGIGLLILKLDGMQFDWNFNFPIERMRMKKRTQSKKDNWYLGLSYALHRQFVYPNRDDRIIMGEASDTSEYQPFQWGVALNIGRTFRINDQFNLFAEAAFGFNSLEHAFGQRFLNSGGFVRQVEDENIKTRC